MAILEEIRMLALATLMKRPVQPAAPAAAQEQLIDIDAAAQLLGVSKQWLYDHPELPFSRRVGHRRRFSLRALQEYIRQAG